MTVLEFVSYEKTIPEILDNIKASELLGFDWRKIRHLR
jgi:hypothetical protein